MLEDITHRTFESIVRETIELTVNGDRFTAHVESVNLLHRNPGQERQPFSVLLQAHDAKNRGQDIYQLSHPDFGVLDLFLVPVRPGKLGVRYEIVFN